MYKIRPYYYGIGKIKHSTARVRVYAGSGIITVNGRELTNYFGGDLITTILKPLAENGMTDKFDIVCKVKGGGLTYQARAIRRGISLALKEYSEERQYDECIENNIKNGAREFEENDIFCPWCGKRQRNYDSVAWSGEGRMDRKYKRRIEGGKYDLKCNRCQRDFFCYTRVRYIYRTRRE